MPLVVTVGLDELPELIRQSEEFATAWQKCGLAGWYVPLAGHDHFSIVEELARPDGRLLAELLTWGAPTWPPTPPSVRSAPAKPWRSSN